MKKSVRFLVATGVACSMLFSISAGAASMLPNLSAYPTRIVVDGMSVSKGPMPLYQDNKALMPLRNVLENSGFAVSWDGQKQLVHITAPNTAAYEIDLQRKELRTDSAVLWEDPTLIVKNGTTYTDPALLEQIPELDFQWDAATNAAILTTSNPKDNVYCYDLGEGTLDNPSRPDTPYQMQGVIGVPEGEKRPIVLILHGSHPVEKASENRYDLGFSYLVNELADAGYLAISMNVAINYSFEDGEPIGCERTVQIVEQQTELLARAIAGEQGIFPCDLTGKGDMNRIVMIGHSRAGRDILEVAQRLPDLGADGLLSIAPAVVSPLTDTLPNVPVGILIPQYDGDVSSLDGATIFDMLENTPNRTAPEELIYLKGGNHGGFSTALVRPDPFADADSIAATMAPEKQQRFLIDYTKQFLAAVFDRKQTVFSEVQDLPDSFADCSVLIQTEKQGSGLFSAVDHTVDITAVGAESEWVNASSTVSNTAGAFRLPGGFMQYDLLRIRWDQSDAAVQLPVSADLRDFSYLQLDLAQDSSDERNRQQDQAVTVTLRDRHGQQATVEVPAGTPALQWQSGDIDHIPMGNGEELLMYSTFTPLGTVRLDLQAFQGIDLSAVCEIELGFAAQSGSVMLREIRAV